MAAVKNVRELSNDFVTKGDLKSMSVRDFIVIINHLVKQINPKANFNNNNYSDELHKFLAQIDYPYSVNKSWFKTPNAPHSLSHIVVMLDFLLDYLPWEESHGFQHDYDSQASTIKGSSFPSVQFTHHFRQKVTEGYHLWNNEKDSEFNRLKQALKDELIAANGDGFMNQSEMIADCARMEKEIAAIVPVARMDQREIEKLEQAVIAKNAELTALVDARKVTSTKNEKLAKDLRNQQVELKELLSEEDDLKKVVARQAREKIREDYDEMSQEFARLNAMLQSKQTFFDRLSQAHYNKMLLHTKLVHKKSDLQSNLMLKLMELKSQPEIRELLQLDDIKELESVSELERLKQHLGNFLATGLNSRSEEVASIEKQIGELNNLKIAFQTGVLNNFEMKLTDLNAEYSRLQSELAESKLKKKIYYEQLEEGVQKKNMQIEELRRADELNRSELVRLEAEKQQILMDTRRKIAYIKEEHKKNEAKFRETLKELDFAMQQLRDA